MDILENGKVRIRGNSRLFSFSFFGPKHEVLAFIVKALYFCLKEEID